MQNLVKTHSTDTIPPLGRSRVKALHYSIKGNTNASKCASECISRLTSVKAITTV